MEVSSLMIILNDKMPEAHKQLIDYQMKKNNINYLLVQFNFDNLRNKTAYLTLDKQTTTVNKILLIENLTYINTKISFMSSLSDLKNNSYLSNSVYFMNEFEKEELEDKIKFGISLPKEKNILNNNIFSDQYEMDKHIYIHKNALTDKKWVMNKTLHEKSYNNLIMSPDNEDYEKYLDKNKCYLSIFYLTDDNIHIFCKNQLNTEHYNLRFILLINITDVTKNSKHLKKIFESNRCEFFIIGHINSLQLKAKLQDEKFKNMDVIELINDCYVVIENKDLYLLKLLQFIQLKLLKAHEKVIFVRDISRKLDSVIAELNEYENFYDNFVRNEYICISTLIFNQVIFTDFHTRYQTILDNYPVVNEKTFIEKTLQNKITYQKEKIDSEKLDVYMGIKMYDFAMKIIDKLIEDNYDVYNGFDLIKKRVALDVLCEKMIDQSNLLRVINSLNDVTLLKDICILASQHPNKQIIERCFGRLLSLLVERNDPNDKLIIKFCISKLRNFTEKETAYLLLKYVKNLEPTETDYKLVKDDLMKVISIFLKYNMNDTDLVSKYEELLDNNVINLEDISGSQITEYLYDKSLNFNPYYKSIDFMYQNREKINKNLDILVESYNVKYNLDTILNVMPNNFNLSYQGLPSCEIFKKRCTLFRKICPELNFVTDLTFKNEKINILFHAEQLTREHSVYKDRHQVIAQLSNDDRFNVYFTTFAKLGENVKYTFGKAKHIILPQNLGLIRQKLVDLKLDVICYCELGMHPISYFMAFMRLAKIQLNSWGHSDSCGIDTVDYFISSKLYELPYEESQKHYSEKLILLDSLSTYYINPMSRHKGKRFRTRNQLGMTDELDIYFCAQSGFKLTPFYDEYLIKILEGNKNARVILLHSAEIDKIISRFNNKNIGNQLVIIPQGEHFTYLNYINISDVILDPYPFGGCNSSLESFSLNKPVVTQPSRMINGRFTLGFYKKMGIEDLIANNMEEYVDIAKKLISDKDFYKQVTEKIKDNHSKLFNEDLTITEWKDLIINFLS
jgi:predicted O-linked N-acetylglucosamine transferase (SPINDLY family)